MLSPSGNIIPGTLFTTSFRLIRSSQYNLGITDEQLIEIGIAKHIEELSVYAAFGKEIVRLFNGKEINATATPENCVFGDMKDIVSPDAPEDIYISPVGCYGIVRRKIERNTKINTRLEEVLLSISAKMSAEEIEKRSRVQHRGRFSDISEEINSDIDEVSNGQMSLLDLLNEQGD